MAKNDLLLRRCRTLAGEDPPRALVLLWRHLRQQGNLEPGFDRRSCEQAAETALQALQEGREPSAAHPAALLRAIDRFLALLDAGHEPRVRRVEIGRGVEDAFFLVPRHAGWTSRFATSQPGHLEYWMRHYLVAPVAHRGITIGIRPSPHRLSKPPVDARLPFAAGGFADGIFPRWNESSPYRCHQLTDPEVRWGSVEAVLAEATRRKAAVVVLPELTVDRQIRGLLAGWLRENRSPFALVVAGSFHEDDSGEVDGAGPRRNVARVFDQFGDEVLRQVKLRPMRAMPKGPAADEEIEGGTRLQLIHAWFGLLGIAICLDFCETGDTPVTDLWRAVGPTLVLVPSMGTDTTNNAHRAKARPLALQHGTAVLVASQHPEEMIAVGVSWDGSSVQRRKSPVLHGALRWTIP